MTDAPSPLKRYRLAQNASLGDLGSVFGIDKSTVMRWENGRVPAERVLEVERITGVSRHDLRPDLYPREERAA
jgi:DNA-binding transcriptional regulator YdaS (Cro superfamily)